MAPFRLDPRQAPGAALQHASAEQVELALAVLEAALAWPSERRGSAVHGFRKATKRVRAALDLARHGGDSGAVILLRNAFRESSRALSRVRDRDALSAVLAQVARKLPKATRASVLAKWRALLLPSAVSRTAGRPERAVADIKSRLLAIRRLWSHVRLARLTPAVLAEGFERSWERARRRFQGAWQRKNAEWLHETRKRCQRLHYQVMLLESWRPKRFGKVREGLADAGEALGMARDTGLLLARTGGVIAPPEAKLKTLRRLLEREHRAALAQARKAGRRALRMPGSEVRRLIERTASEYARRSAHSRPAAAVADLRS
ncbi:MAG: CHAD domain-containing protein [Phycisphaeraceae bacterium]|nr:CHAD domain-containing protein [Phycisphaeraceae bacterium]